MEEGVEGFVRAMSPKLVTPRFISTAGPWVRLGEHQTRVPPDVAIATTKARDGRHIAVIAHLDESDHPGKVQVLVGTVQGVRELVGLAPEHLQELRMEFFGR